MVQRELVKIDLAEKFHPFRDWKNNPSLVCTCGIGRGLEGVDRGMARTSREWRPEGRRRMASH